MGVSRDNEEHNMESQSLRPDTVLSVYCLQGTLPEQECWSVDGFLGNWQEGGYSFLFFQRPVDGFINDLVARHSCLKVIDQYEMTYGQWQNGVAEPFQLGSFLIRPPGTRTPAEHGRLSFTLDAGLVFGDGTHPTTRDCLAAIEMACADWEIETMLDLGTGTGVLALGAARLGVSKIAAVDYNLLAARTAGHNVRLNSLANTIVVVNGRAEDFVCVTVDLVVANIHYEVMKNIAESGDLSRQKLFVLSGLLGSEMGQIVRILEKTGATILKRWEAEHAWQTILGAHD